MTRPSRAVVPSVGKALEAGIVVMFIALLTTTLFGSVVPNARTAAADEVGERTLQHAAASVERAVPPAGANAVVEHHVSLPDTIRGRDYRIAADGDALVLVHANERVGGRTPLTRPDRVQLVRGNWTTDTAVVRVKPHPDSGLVVVLVEGSA